MNSKKIMLVTLLLLAVLTMGAVSASDNIDNLTATDNGADDLNIEAPVDDEILTYGNYTVFVDNVIYPENNTVEAVQNAIDSANDGDVVDLSNFDEYDFGESGITIDKTITFRGNGDTVISGNGDGNGLVYVTAYNVTICALQFIDTNPNNDFTYHGNVAGYGVRYAGVTGGELTDCIFQDFYRDISVMGSYDIVIENNYFHGGYVTLLANDPTVNVERGTTPVSIYRQSSRITIINNVFEGPALDGVMIAQGSGGNIVENNTFVNISYGIYLGGASSKDSKVRSNSFINCGQFKEGDIEITGMPVIEIRKASNDVVIEDNTFVAAEDSILIGAMVGNEAHGIPSALTNITVTGNTVTKYSDEVDARSIVLFHVQVNEGYEFEEDETIVVGDNNLDEGVREFVVWYDQWGDEYNMSSNFDVNMWNVDDGRGTLYTDSEGDVVSISVPEGLGGTIVVVANGIEFEWEIDDTYRDWSLEDLDLMEVGDYDVEVRYYNEEYNADGVILAEDTLSVNEFNNDEFRAMLLYADEEIVLYVPDGAEGTVTIITDMFSDDGSEQVNEEVYELTEGHWGDWVHWSLSDLGFEADNMVRIFNLTVTNGDEEIYHYMISYADGEGEDDGEDEYLENIIFEFNYLDDEGGYIEKASYVDIGYVYIPHSEDMEEFDGIDVVTLYVTLNGQEYATFDVLDLYGFYSGSRHALGFEVPLDMTNFKDKDMLVFRLEAEFANGQSAITEDNEFNFLILEDKGDYFIGHGDDYDPERFEFNVFYGNMTTGTLNDPDLMGPRFDGLFADLVISDYYNVTEGSLTVMDGNSVIFSKALSEMNKVYSYDSVGYEYFINLDEVANLIPKGREFITSFSYGNDTIDDQKRIRFGDYMYCMVLPSDVFVQFEIDVADDVLSDENDAAISVISDTNRQSIYISLGGGYFTVYVNDEKVGHLGNITFNNWLTLSNWEEEDGDYLDGYYPNKETFISDVKDCWGDELELFRMTSWHQGCPEFNITLADLGITESGNYNIRITHYPSVAGGLDDHSNMWGDYSMLPEYLIPAVTELINMNITVKFSEPAIPELMITVPDVSYGEDADIEIEMNDTINELIYVNVGGADYTLNVVNGKASLILSGLAPGVYDVDILFMGNEEFYSAEAITSFEVSKLASDIAIAKTSTGATITLTSNKNPIADAVITYSVNGNDFKGVTDENGAVTISELSDEFSEIAAYYAGDEYYLESDANATILSYRVAADIQINANNIAVGEDLIVNVQLPSDVTRRVTVAIGEDERLISLKNGTGSVKFSDLDIGTYTVKVSYGGDAVYLKSSATAKVKVTKPKAEIQLTAENITVGDVLIVTVQMPSDVTRRPVLSIGNDSKIVTLKNGIGTAKFSGLTAGTHTVKATFSGDTVYLKSSASLKVKVNKPAADILLTADDVVIGDVLVVNIQMPADVTRRVTVTVNGEDKLVTLKNGVGTAKFKNLAIGSYTVKATYGGDAQYGVSSASIKAKVTNPKADINITANAISVGETLVVEIQLPSDVTRRASVTVGNVTKTVTLKQGKGTAKFTDLAMGTYTVDVLYGGDANYIKSSARTTVKVNRAAANIQVTANAVAYGDDLEVNVQLPSDVTRRVSVTIGNVTKTVSLKDGKATVKFSGLAVGTYTITTSYGGDAIYLKSSLNTTVKVTKAVPEIQVTANDIAYGDALTVAVKLPADVAKRAVVTIDGKIYYVSLKDGSGSIKISGLSVGTHDVEVSYAGDAKYKKASFTTSVEVTN